MNLENRNIRILIVDDHQLLRQGLHQLIANVPGLHVIGEANTGASAIEQLRALKPDVILMDVHLQSENGVEVTRQILAEFPSMKVIALSSDGDLQLVINALHAGAAGYILKQNGSDELVRAIHAVMDHRLYLSPELSSVVIKEFMKSPPVTRATRSACALSEREKMLLQLVAQGKRNKEIAESLDVAVKSAETYRARLMQKLGVGSTAELVRYAIREGIVEP